MHWEHCFSSLSLAVAFSRYTSQIYSVSVVRSTSFPSLVFTNFLCMYITAFLTFIILYLVGLRTILRLFFIIYVWLRLSTIIIKRKWWWWWWCSTLSQNFTPIAPSCVKISSTVQTNKTKQNSKLNITPNATLYGEIINSSEIESSAFRLKPSIGARQPWPTTCNYQAVPLMA